MKTKYILFSIVGLLALSSCSKLDENPNALLVSEQYFKNKDQAIAAVNGTYRKLYESGQSIYNGLFQIGVEMATDDYEAGPRARNAHVRAIAGLTHDASNDRMEQLWKQSYDAINASNWNIDQISVLNDAVVPADLRNRLVNEAKFLRALHYFNLVRWFGDVPLVLHTTSTLTNDNIQVEKSSSEEVYAQIVKDLKDAEALPNYKSYGDSEIGRATSGAAKSLLAKVYLTQNNWDDAKAKAKDVIDNEGYQLFETFADVFAVDKKNGKEHIFSAQFKGNSGYQGNSLAGRSAPTDIPGINGDYADALHLEGGLYASYEAQDKRKEVTFTNGLVSPVDGKFYALTKPQFHKYYDESVIGNQSQSSKNISIIRYAEVLLIFAEAENEINGVSQQSLDAVNQVRQRAGLKALTIGEVGSKNELRELIFEERRKEFVYEYQRWFDLVRRGPEYYISKLKGAGKTQAAARHIHFPTPQRELNLNKKLKQHPDWINY